MTPTLVTTLAEHAAGNCRTMMLRAAELLTVAAERDLRQLDEKLFFDVYAAPPPPPRLAVSAKTRRR
jgi:hypothetical protein